jgi:hypothetical protein
MNGSREIWRSLYLRTILCSFCCLLLPPVFAHDVLHPLNPVGSTELSFDDSRSGSIRVTILQSELGDSYSYADALLWGGDVHALPQHFVHEIRIQRNNKPIYIPLSAYGDLGDVMSVSFGSSTHGFRLSLHGSDTARSYDATLYFERGVLIRRDVRLRELPGERWEKTTYGSPGSAT